MADRIPEARRFSRVFRNRRELIDHILVSRELLFAQRQVDAFIETVEPITESTRARRDAIDPDHAPVFARFEITV